jgi:hypothetical protein
MYSNMPSASLVFFDLDNLVQPLRNQSRKETDNIGRKSRATSTNITQEYIPYYVLYHANSTTPRSLAFLSQHGNSKLTHVAHVSYT